MVVKDWTDMLDALEYLRHEGDKWDWVWLDSISLFQDVGLDDMFAAAVEAKPSRKEYGPDRAEYRVNMWRLEQFIRHAVGAELFNFGVTAHPFWMTMQGDESPESAYEKLMPWIQGKAMPTKISGYMNIVGFMEVKNNKDGERRVIHTRANQRWFAKDQFNAFGATGDITNPTMPGIVAAIEATRSDGRGGARRGTARRTPGRTPVTAGRTAGRTRRER